MPRQTCWDRTPDNPRILVGGELSLPVRYVTLYEVDRHYGGPEEGGWWYDWYTPLKSIRLNRPALPARIDQIRAQLVEMYGMPESRRNRYSVNGGCDMQIMVELTRHEYASTITPHYE